MSWNHGVALRHVPVGKEPHILFAFASPTGIVCDSCDEPCRLFLVTGQPPPPEPVDRAVGFDSWVIKQSDKAAAERAAAAQAEAIDALREQIVVGLAAGRRRPLPALDLQREWEAIIALEFDQLKEKAEEFAGPEAFLADRDAGGGGGSAAPEPELEQEPEPACGSLRSSSVAPARLSSLTDQWAAFPRVALVSGFDAWVAVSGKRGVAARDAAAEVAADDGSGTRDLVLEAYLAEEAEAEAGPGAASGSEMAPGPALGEVEEEEEEVGPSEFAAAYLRDDATSTGGGETSTGVGGEQQPDPEVQRLSALALERVERQQAHLPSHNATQRISSRAAAREAALPAPPTYPSAFCCPSSVGGYMAALASCPLTESVVSRARSLTELLLRSQGCRHSALP